MASTKASDKLTDIALNNVSADTLLSLDNQLCFSLYVCSKEVIKRYKPLLDPYGLTYTGYITLMALWEEDGINVKSLGEKLFLDSGTLTPLLKKLEAQGYVTRERSPEDERNMIVKLTYKGKQLKGEITCVPKQLLADLDYSNVKSYLLMKSLHELMDVFAEENGNSYYTNKK